MSNQMNKRLDKLIAEAKGQVRKKAASCKGKSGIEVLEAIRKAVPPGSEKVFRAICEQMRDYHNQAPRVDAKGQPTEHRHGLLEWVRGLATGTFTLGEQLPPDALLGWHDGYLVSSRWNERWRYIVHGGRKVRTTPMPSWRCRSCRQAAPNSRPGGTMYTWDSCPSCGATKMERVDLGKVGRERYYSDPVLYIQEVLKIQPWQRQVDICEALLKPPYRVLGRASHAVGKTHMLSCLCSWFFDTRPRGCCITTAPTHRDVTSLLWREIRLQRQRVGLGGFIGPQAPELRTSHDHYCMGFTASAGESFQGRHQPDLMLVFDEAIGVKSVFWETALSMFDGGSGRHFWATAHNPTETSSEAFQQEQKADPDTGKPLWSVVELGSPEHPNLIAALRDPNGEIPFPGAVTLAQFRDWLSQWAEPVSEADHLESDLMWPPERPCPCCRPQHDPMPEPIPCATV
jgi:hypothetical protein